MSFRILRGKTVRTSPSSSRKSPARGNARGIALETLEERSTPATMTGGTGPGGFLLANGTTDVAWWFDAASLGLADNDNVTAWNDQSGYARNLTTPTATTGGATHSITFQSDAGNLVNGNPTVQFDSMYLRATNFTSTLSAGAEMFVALKATSDNGADNGGFHNFNGGNQHYTWSQNIYETFGTNSRRNFNPASPLSTFHVYDVAASASTWSMRINNASSGGDFYSDTPNLAFSTGAANMWLGRGDYQDAPWQGNIGELVVFRNVLNSTQKNIVANYLSSRYGTTMTAGDLYQGDTSGNGDYDQNVFGIGRTSAADQVLTAGQAGFGIEATSLDDGDFVLAGHKATPNSFTTAGTLPAGVVRRWSRVWNVDVTDANSSVTPKVAFDYSDAGLSIGLASTFALLRSIDGGATWTSVAATQVQTGDKLEFTLSGALTDGLYTLGDASGPVLTIASSNQTYAIGAPAVAIDAGLTVAAGGNPTMTGATVSVAGFVNGDADVLSFTPSGAVNGTYDNTTGILTLSGSDNAATYQTVLRSVSFSKASFQATPSRTINFTITDAASLSTPGSRGILIAASAASDSIVWDGTGDGVTWTDNSNWVGDLAPDSNDVAVFSGTDPGPVNVPTNITIGSISFTNSGAPYTITNTGGAIISLTIGNVTQTGSTGNTISSAMAALSPATAITFDVAASTLLSVSGNISGAGDLNKNGAGTLRLSATANTYTGATNVNVGTLQAQGAVPSSLINLSNTAGGLNIADANHVKASSAYTPDGRLPQNTSNWAGQTGTFPTGTAATGPANTTWLSNGTTGAGTWIAWDFGSIYNISQAHVWNYNEASPWFGRGTKSFDLQIATSAPPEFGGTGSWVTIQAAVDWSNTGLYQGTGLAGYAGFDYTWATPFSSQYVRFNNVLNYGTADAYTGLSEIIFSSPLSTSRNSVPDASPVTVAPSATLDLMGTAEAVGSLAGGGLVTSSTSGAAALTSGGNNTSTAFTGVLQNGAGTLSLTKTGTGTLTLSGVNTFSGGTSIQGGTLQLAGGANRLNPSAGIQIGAAGTLDLNNQDQAVLTLSGAGKVVDSTNDSTFPDLTINNGATATVDVVLGNTNQNGFDLFKAGAGTTTLTGNNTYTGKTTISAGTLAINGDGRLGTAPGSFVSDQITIAGGASLNTTATFTLSANRGITLTGSGTLNINAGTTLTYAGRFSGGGGLIKAGTGDLTLTNTAGGTNPGTININAGRIHFDNQNAVGGGIININNGGTLSYVGASALSLSNSVVIANGGNISSRLAQLTSSATLPTTGTLIINADDQNTNTVVLTSPILLSGALTVQVGGPINGTAGNGGVGRLDGLLSGNFGVTKTQTGVLHLNNASNSFTGDVNVSGGTLRVTAVGQLGTTAGGTNVGAGATLELNGAFNFTGSETISLAGQGFGGVGALNKVGGSGSFSAPLVLAASAGIGNGTAGTVFTFINPINMGSRALTFTGAGDISVPQAISGSVGGPAPPNLGGVTSGLQIWFDASQITGLSTGQTVSTWVDASGQAHNGTASGTPTYDATGFGGKAAVRMNAGGFNLGNLATSFPSAATVFYMVKLESSANYTFLNTINNDHWDRYDGNGFAYPGAFRNPRIEAYTDMPTTGTFVFDLVSTSSRWEMWENGASQGVAAAGYNAGNNYNLGIHNSRFVEGLLAEMIVYNRELSPAEQISVRDYLAGKYAVALDLVNDLTKNGTGTLTLGGNNTYAGATNVNAGTLVVTNPNALGTTAGATTIGNGATLGLSGGITLTGETISFTGSGAAGQPGVLVGMGGANTYAGNVTLGGGTSAIGATSGSLTITGNVDMANTALTLGGAGDVVIQGVVSGTLSGVGIPTLGGVTSGLELWLDASQITGLSTGQTVSTWSDVSGKGHNATASGTPTYDAAGLGGKPAVRMNSAGFNLGNLGSFFPTAATAFYVVKLENDTNYTFLSTINNDHWTRYDGNGLSYPGTFRTSRVETYTDMPQNGTFIFDETSTSTRWEMFENGVSQGVAAANYNPGNNYTIGLHNSRDIDGLMAEMVVFNRELTPLEQQKVWAYLSNKYSISGGFPAVSFRNDLTKTGSGTATLSGNNTYGGLTTVNAGTLVAANNNALGSAANGVTVNDGGTLGLTGGVTLSGEPILANGLGAGGQGAIANISGANTLASSSPITAVHLNNGQLGIGAAAGSLTIQGSIDLKASNLTFSGAGNVSVNGNVGSSSPLFIDPTQRDYILGSGVAGLPGYSPLAYWEFNEASGAVAQDSSGNNNIGNFTGAATRFTGWTGGASDRALDVTAGGTVNVPVSGQFNSINVNDKVTLAFWIFLLPGGTRNNTTFAATNGGTQVARTHAPWGDGVTYWDAGQGQRVQTAALTAAQNEGAWHYWVMTKDSVGASQKIYRDGVEVATGAGNQLFADITSVVIAPDFRGRLDDVLLLNTALSAAQVTALWNARNGTGSTTVNNALTKTGAGTLTLAGANSYTGTTTVSGGTLEVNSSLPAGGGNVAVGSGATLGGTGTVARTVNVASGGTVTGGAGPSPNPGILNSVVTNFTGGANLFVEIGGTTAGTQHDQLHIPGSATGSVNLAGANLVIDLTGSFVPANGNRFVIIENDSPNPITGIFNGVPEGGSILGDGASFLVSYNYNSTTGTPGTGNDVALVADTPTVAFTGATFSASEGAGTTLVVTLTRTGNTTFASSVQVSVTGGVATTGPSLPADFLNNFPKTINFLAGETTVSVPITLFDDAVTDNGKTIQLAVASSSNALIGGQSTTLFTIIDNDNALPTANAGGPYTVPEGGSVTLSGAASTDSDGTIVLYEWDLDDNGSYEVSSTSPTTSFNAATLGYDGLTPAVSHTVGLRVTDNQGGLGTTTATVNVTNVNPVINTFTVPTPRLEGGTVIGSAAATDAAGALDPLTYTWTVSGPGIVGSLVFTGTSFSTAAIDNGSYSVSLTVSDGDGGSATQATSVVVNNVAPDFELGANETLPLNVGSFSRGGLSFTDPGTADTWTATVNYGDGSGTVPLSLSGMTFSLAHNYVTPTTYTVTVVITDDDLGSHTDSFTVTVQAPTVVYVDDAWAAFTLGDTVVDADPVAGGNQAAVYGFNAHALPNAAVSAVAVGGTVYNNAGDYDEAAVVNKTVSYVFQEGPISIGSFGDSGPGGNSTYSLGVALTVGDNDGASTLTGPVSGAGSLTKVGSGVMTLAGTIANSYSGGTFVSEGTLALNKTAGVDGVAGPITIGSGAVGGVVKTAILRVDQSDQIPDAATITFSGGDGRLFIASGSETIANPTALAAGDIKIAGSLTLTSAFTQTAGSSVTMAGGSLRIGTTGTFGGVDDYSLAGTLQGSGTIYTKLLTSSGTIDPSSGATEASLGNATPGRINIRGNLQLTGSSVTNLDVGSASSDQLNVGINVGLPLPAGSYTNLSNYELDPYLRGDVAAVTEPGRRGVNDLYNVNGTVRLDGTLNTRPIIGATPTATAATMNFVWRALNLPPGNLDPRGANLSSVPSDFAFRNSFTSAGVPVAPNAPSGNTRFEARFMGSGGQANAIGQSVNFMTKVGVVDQAVLSAPAYVLGQAKSLTLTPLTNVATSTANLKMTKQLWNAMKDSHTRVTVTVTNTTGATVTGPFYLEITSVTGNSPVFNQAGKTQVNNKPYLVIVPRDAAGNALSTLANGATATVEVDLLTPIVQGKTAALTANVLFGGLP